MMPYSNKYNAIPICRTHIACVNTPNFDACVRATTRARTHASKFIVCAFKFHSFKRSHPFVCERTGSDNARVPATKLSLVALVVA